jgi:hypothetical protein
MNNNVSLIDQLGSRRLADDLEKPAALDTGSSFGRISVTDCAAGGIEESEYMLGITGIHQDAVSREWATQVTNQAIQLVGERAVRSHWWEMSEFGNPGAFRDAVQSAAEADILVVSVRATDALPLDLYDWIEAWLPLRLPVAGVLVALIGVPEPPGADASRIRHYLQDVAWRGELEFLSQDYELPPAFSGLSLRAIAERASAARRNSDRIIDLQHWGINE